MHTSFYEYRHLERVRSPLFKRSEPSPLKLEEPSVDEDDFVAALDGDENERIEPTPEVEDDTGMQSEESIAKLVFLRVSFGALMMVHAAAQCTNDEVHPGPLDMLPMGLWSHLPASISTVLQGYPWYTDPAVSPLYWRLHAPLLLLSAAGLSLAPAGLARLSCLGFGLLKLVSVLRDASVYNNHDYLYATLALLLTLLDTPWTSSRVCRDPGKNCGLQKAFIEEAAGSSSSSSSSSRVVSWRLLLLMGALPLLVHNAVRGSLTSVLTPAAVLLIWTGALLGAARGPTRDTTAPMEDRWEARVVRGFVAVVYLWAGSVDLFLFSVYSVQPFPPFFICCSPACIDARDSHPPASACGRSLSYFVSFPLCFSCNLMYSHVFSCILIYMCVYIPK